MSALFAFKIEYQAFKPGGIRRLRFPFQPATPDV
jgi:hypothetical protein